MRFRIGTRPSPLAMAQVKEAVDFICRNGKVMDVEVVPIQSDGDLDKKTVFSKMEGTDFFTRRLEEALRRGEIDLAIHSAKDLEEDLPQDLMIVLMTPSLSACECLVAKGPGMSLASLPPLSRVGTSSRKRQEAVLRYRPDLLVKGIRGTIEERLSQLDCGDFDAVIIAHAALLRLGLEARISELVSGEILPPHPLQGRIAVQARSTDKTVLDFFSEK